MISTQISGTEFGGVREDIISKLGIIMGQDKAAAAFDQFEQLIEQRAAAGASRKVKPMIIGSMAIGGVGLLLGGAAIAIAMRR